MAYSKVTGLLAAVLLSGTIICSAGAVRAADKVEAPEEYLDWLDDLKEEMIDRGISKKTIKKVYAEDYYHPEPEVVKIDRNQTEFVLTFTDYANRVVTAKRVAEAQTKYKELYPLFKDLEGKYGVPFNYLVAFWAMESNFGRNFGNYQVVDALTVLSYDRRRPKFFREELYQALKIIDDWEIDHTKMEGSWAGAMGHFQFMPSTFNAYAVDYNGDGKIDIWHSFEDAAASAANYLHEAGWKAGEPWGAEVSLPWNFDYAQTGRTKLKTVKEWAAAGVRLADNKKLPFAAESKGAVLLPEGKKGKAYLVLHNFNVIMKWNRSENYALAVGLLADYTVSGKKWKAMAQVPAVRLKADDVLKVQAFINKLGWFKLDEDGQLGSKTREAIQKVQQKAKLQPDGYPDYQLLNKINKYNPDIGFAVPVQPRKLHRRK